MSSMRAKALNERGYRGKAGAASRGKGRLALGTGGNFAGLCAEWQKRRIGAIGRQLITWKVATQHANPGLNPA